MSTETEYTGLDKYPGWIATGITLVITAVFLGALLSGGGHDAEHGEAGHGEAGHEAPAEGHAE